MKEMRDEKKDESNQWWVGSSVYQIYPRSFCDSTDDGVGDLNGITSKLEYIKSLNVTAIWICPFYKSPMVDFGYDVSDYRSIDPLFGDLENFKSLLHKAHELGLKVIVDLVINHTSQKHEWFEKSVNDPNSKYGDYYVWHESENIPNNWLSVFGGPAWSYSQKRKAWYMHNFLKEQPDLNLHNPLVREELMQVAKFWLDFGVDGFRLDACNMYFHSLSLQDNPPVIKNGVALDGNVQDEKNPYFSQQHLHNKSQPDNVEFLKELRSVIEEYDSKYLVGEIFCEREEATTNDYSRNGYPLHSAYNFSLLVNSRPDNHMSKSVKKFYKISKDTSWSFSNHDVVRVASRWKDDQPTKSRAKAYNTILSGLPGSIIVYQGEELGLEEAKLPTEFRFDPFGSNIDSPYPGRDGCRTPIPWEKDALNGGFSTGAPWLPIPDTHLTEAVDVQEVDDESVLNHMRQLLSLRKDSEVIKNGSIAFHTDENKVIAYERKLENEAFLFCCNLGNSSYSYPIPNTSELLSQISERCSIENNNNLAQLNLEPGGFAVISM